MDSLLAAKFARRLAASYPSSRIAVATLDEWAGEFVKLTEQRAGEVLDWLRDNVETAPTFKQIRLAMARCSQPKKALHIIGEWEETPGLASPCEFCQQPVPQGPDAASRYDAEFDRWFNAHLSCADARRPALVEGD